MTSPTQSAMEQQQREELLPCPFCAGVPRIVTRNVEPQGDPWYGRKDETFVLCDCGACLFDGDFHEGFYAAETRAVAAWNRRSQASELRSLRDSLALARSHIGELREALEMLLEFPKTGPAVTAARAALNKEQP